MATLDEAPAEIILIIASNLCLDDIAYLSITCRSIREYTKGHRSIDISQIAYKHSKKDIISILKLLRFHPFKTWRLPADTLLYKDPQIIHLITSMMQSKFTEKNYLKAWIRNKWNVDSFCEIKINEHWIKGQIIDSPNTQVSIQYTHNSDSIKTKNVDRDDYNSVRPLSSAMQMYKYIYTAINGHKSTQHLVIKGKCVEFVYPLNAANVRSRWFDDEHPLMRSLSNIEVHHLKLHSCGKITGRTVNWQYLVSLTSSYKSVKTFLQGVKSFDNLEILCIEFDQLSDDLFVPYDVFGQNTMSKFPKLRKFCLKRQRISGSFLNLFSCLSLLPCLAELSIANCIFLRDAFYSFDEHIASEQSKSLRSLHLNTVSLNKKRLSVIADCFGKGLENVHFVQCKLPKNKAIWTDFGAKCENLEHLYCEKICSSVTTLWDGWSTHYSRKCKAIYDPNVFDLLFKEVFKDKSNIKITVKKPETLWNKINYNQILQNVYDNGEEFENKEPETMNDYGVKFEQCKLCGMEVAVSFMNDHLDNMCVNKLIECVLCKVKIKRKDMTNHWNSECNGYVLRCNDCGEVFRDKKKYYDHMFVHRHRDDSLKRGFHFFGDSKEHRDNFCDDKSIQLAKQCKRCQRRYVCKDSEHKCPKECIDWGVNHFKNICQLCDIPVPIGKMKDHLDNICINQMVECVLCKRQIKRRDMRKHWNLECDGYKKSNRALSMMRQTVPSLNGRDIIQYWIKNELKKDYVPSEILLMIVLFYAGNHDFTYHKEKDKDRIRMWELKQCTICSGVQSRFTPRTEVPNERQERVRKRRQRAKRRALRRARNV